MLKWRKLASQNQLVLKHTLMNGQCFGWKPIEYDFSFDRDSSICNNGVDSRDFNQIEVAKTSKSQASDSLVKMSYVGVIDSCAVQLCEQRGDVWFRALNAPECSFEEAKLEQCIRDYFQLDTVDLSALYADWSSRCPRMAAIAARLPGMRVLRQDPLECLISFICSSNNNISRIKMMLTSLRKKFGTRIGVDEKVFQEFKQAEENNGKDMKLDELSMYQFPTLSQLLQAEEEELRRLGFGYRAKYIVGTVSKLDKMKMTWLHELREQPQTEAAIEKIRNDLETLDGVGPKVADCVALFSLDRYGSIPVDTHVWQIACREFDPGLLEHKSLTPSVYGKVGELFRQTFGDYAGWAHCLLFSAELPLFQDLLPESVRKKMAEFAALEKARKLSLKAKKEALKSQKHKTVKEESSAIVKEKQTSKNDLKMKGKRRIDRRKIPPRKRPSARSSKTRL